MYFYPQDDIIPHDTISEFSIKSGDARGLHMEEGAVEIDLQKYAHLKPNQTEQVVVTYNSVSPFGAEIPQTAVFLMTGTNAGASLSAANANSVLVQNFNPLPNHGKIRIALTIEESMRL